MRLYVVLAPIFKFTSTSKHFQDSRSGTSKISNLKRLEILEVPPFKLNMRIQCSRFQPKWPYAQFNSICLFIHKHIHYASLNYRKGFFSKSKLVLLMIKLAKGCVKGSDKNKRHALQQLLQATIAICKFGHFLSSRSLCYSSVMWFGCNKFASPYL